MWSLKWKWLLWQVAVPLVGPIAMSGFVVLLWSLGSRGFTIKWDIVVDMTPWALTFYAITLIGATMNDFVPNFSRRVGTGIGLVLTAVGVSIYTAFMVIWRHDQDFKPTIGIWIATGIFVAVTICLCHQAEA